MEPPRMNSSTSELRGIDDRIVTDQCVSARLPRRALRRPPSAFLSGLPLVLESCDISRIYPPCAIIVVFCRGLQPWQSIVAPLHPRPLELFERSRIKHQAHVSLYASDEPLRPPVRQICVAKFVGNQSPRSPRGSTTQGQWRRARAGLRLQDTQAYS